MTDRIYRPIDLKCKDTGDANIIYYISGYIAHSMEKGGLCTECAESLRLSKTPPDIVVEDGGDGEGTKAYSKFLENINRGGLSTPSDLCYITCLYVFNIFCEIMERQEAKVQFFECQEPRKVFCELVILRLDLDSANDLLNVECDAGHSFTKGPLLKNWREDV